METQSRYIAELRNEIYSLKAQTNAESMLTQKSVSQVEDNCKKSVDQSYLKFEKLLLNRSVGNKFNVEIS
jgi:hypothetical protein